MICFLSCITRTAVRARQEYQHAVVGPLKTFMATCTVLRTKKKHL